MLPLADLKTATLYHQYVRLTRRRDWWRIINYVRCIKYCQWGIWNDVIVWRHWIRTRECSTEIPPERGALRTSSVCVCVSSGDHHHSIIKNLGGKISSGNKDFLERTNWIFLGIEFGILYIFRSFCSLLSLISKMKNSIYLLRGYPEWINFRYVYILYLI